MSVADVNCKFDQRKFLRFFLGVASPLQDGYSRDSFKVEPPVDRAGITFGTYNPEGMNLKALRDVVEKIGYKGLMVR